VKRRAADMYHRLVESEEASAGDPLAVMDWVNLFALAVNEENAAGGRVVTAPTNGAAGIIPAVLHYYVRYVPESSDDGVVRFLLTAGAIGALYKENASISGAEVGCQGEGRARPARWRRGRWRGHGWHGRSAENAAEIAMEHNLGLTCDPIGGLVQIPCIERNAMASIKAINAARMALQGSGEHFRVARQGHPHHARHRRRHEGQIQGDVPRRSGHRRHRRAAGRQRQHSGVLAA
jgi:L-serine dehydratase